MADVQDASSAPTETLDPVEQAVVNGDQSAFKAVRLAQKTGKPLPQVLPTQADSASAQPVEQAAPTDAIPKVASEPAKPKKNADTRVQELLAEREQIRAEANRYKAELESLRRPVDVKPADPSPAKTTRDFERFKAMPDAPKVADYDDYGDWNIDIAAFVQRKGLEEYAQRQRQEYDAGQFRDAQAKFDARGVEAHPDFREVLTAAAQAGRSWPEHVTRKVLTHEHGPAIAYALAKAKDDDALYARIADPVEFGEYVAEVLTSQKAPRTPAQKTTAPDPPFTLGAHPHDSADATDAAVDSGDMYAFKAARLRQRAARLR